MTFHYSSSNQDRRNQDAKWKVFFGAVCMLGERDTQLLICYSSMLVVFQWLSWFYPQGTLDTKASLVSSHQGITHTGNEHLSWRGKCCITPRFLPGSGGSSKNQALRLPVALNTWTFFILHSPWNVRVAGGYALSLLYLETRFLHLVASRTQQASGFFLGWSLDSCGSFRTHTWISPQTLTKPLCCVVFALEFFKALVNIACCWCSESAVCCGILFFGVREWKSTKGNGESAAWKPLTTWDEKQYLPLSIYMVTQGAK